MSKNRYDRSNRKEQGIRTNHRIRSRRVLVIDENGGRVGEFLTPDAIALAQNRGLDLIEVAPNANPPVCKLGDYGKLMYEKKKRDAKAKKNQTIIKVKELKLRPRTEEHDFSVRLRAARKFLLAGDKIKVTIRFRGREMAHTDIGTTQCNRLVKELGELAIVESPPKMEGRQMTMIVVGNKNYIADMNTQNDSEEASQESSED